MLLELYRGMIYFNFIDGCWGCPLGNLQCKPSYLFALGPLSRRVLRILSEWVEARGEQGNVVNCVSLNNIPSQTQSLARTCVLMSLWHSNFRQNGPMANYYGLWYCFARVSNWQCYFFGYKRKYHWGERFLGQRRDNPVRASYDIFIGVDTSLMARRCYCQGYYHIMELDFVFWKQ